MPTCSNVTVSDACEKESSEPDSVPGVEGTLVSTSKTDTSSLSTLEISLENLTSSCPTDRGHFKQPVLKEQIKRFIIENGHCRATGPFKKDTQGRSFSEKYYYIVSKVRVENREILVMLFTSPPKGLL